MKNIRKHIALLLLAVFSFSAVPASLIHSLFAHHHDTEDNYCDYYHKDLGTHIETKHTSCGEFKTQTPLYDALSVVCISSPYNYTITEKQWQIRSAVSYLKQRLLPSRAPPIA